MHDSERDFDIWLEGNLHGLLADAATASIPAPAYNRRRRRRWRLLFGSTLPPIGLKLLAASAGLAVAGTAGAAATGHLPRALPQLIRSEPTLPPPADGGARGPVGAAPVVTEGSHPSDRPGRSPEAEHPSPDTRHEGEPEGDSHGTPRPGEPSPEPRESPDSHPAGSPSPEPRESERPEISRRPGGSPGH